MKYCSTTGEATFLLLPPTNQPDVLYSGQYWLASQAPKTSQASRWSCHNCHYFQSERTYWLCPATLAGSLGGCFVNQHADVKKERKEDIIFASTISVPHFSIGIANGNPTVLWTKKTKNTVAVCPPEFAPQNIWTPMMYPPSWRVGTARSPFSTPLLPPVERRRARYGCSV